MPHATCHMPRSADRMTDTSLCLLFLIIPFLLTLLGCNNQREHSIRGYTMGTTYQVTVVTGRFGSISGLEEKIAGRLQEINRSMSTYIEDSEISRFNRFDQVNRPFPVSEDFMRVLQAGRRIFELSGGAWDATVAPLVDLWGFGPPGKKPSIPSPARLQAVRKTVGFDNIDIRQPGHLVKQVAGITLDFGSIAKGYGVDQVAELLRREGHRNFLVEIGGEIVASGRRPDGRPWRLGINTPRPDAAADEVSRVVTLTDAAFATSGDYRNFFTLDGVRYSHVIDPRTGRPVANGVVSASITAPDCTFADGMATAIMVMGAEAGLQLINRLDDVEAMIVVAEPGGRLVDYFSSGFPRGG